MAINKVIYGNNTLIDLSSDTITAPALQSGIIAHGRDGNAIVGTAAMVYNTSTEELSIPEWAVTLEDG